MIGNKVNKKHKLICFNSGFTMVELIVVLALLAIILSIMIAGGLAWQDWSRFQHEDTMAEEIFIAAQNQFTEYDASGAMERKVMNPLRIQDAVTGEMSYYEGVGGKEGFVLSQGILNSIVYDDEDHTYNWSEIWKTHTVNNGSVDQDVFMLRLKALKGDYDKYLNLTKAERQSIKAGTEGTPITVDSLLLFDLVSPYISDAQALNGAIVLEFSPEAGQVFSVSYSDQQNELVYDEDVSGSIMNRSVQAREKRMIGYCCAEQLYEKLRGRSIADSDIVLEIKNSNTLSMVLHNANNIADGDELQFTIMDGRDKKTVMSFGMKGYSASAFPTSMDAALRDPVPFEVTFNDGFFKSASPAEFRIPVWLKEDNLYFLLDAADVQAQSVSYYKAMLKPGADEEDTEAFKRTFSFYRFGLTDVYYIYARASVSHGSATAVIDSVRNKGSETIPDYQAHIDLPDDEKGPNGEIGECTTFSRVNIPLEGWNRTLEMTNARHLYNVRYETDYKINPNVCNTFMLAADIDWSEFVDTYFLTSYINNETPSGINYKGNLMATHLGGQAQDGFDDYMADCPFPGFRCLDAKDVFTQAAETEYSISGLTITIAANLVFGVYDTAIEEHAALLQTEATREDALQLLGSLARVREGDFKGLMGRSGIIPNLSIDEKNSLRNNPARGGLLPVGLFAENLGRIEHISLKNHTVIGMQTGVQKGEDSTVIYSCMAGGFAGNNIGTVKNLVLDETSSVNGRTDVGGIIGRESFVLDSKESRDVTVSELKNFGTISGMENVGGIVGRVYTHYVDDDNRERNVDYSKDTLQRGNTVIKKDKDRNRYEYYHDGYYISDVNRSLTGAEIKRAGKITISNCSNRGKVSGDPIIYSSSYSMDGVSTAGLHCAFIGGIAGITQDGYILDERDERINGKYAADYYLSGSGFLNNATAYVTVKNCDSFYTYAKTEVEAFADKDEDGKYKNPSIMQDLYVGGLIGYARLTVIENCNENKDYDDEGNVKTTYAASSLNEDVPVVIGRRYVGGIVGCSDFVRYEQGDDPKYAATNYNLVLGERYVGGIAGANGIGSASQGTFSFSNPSENNGSQVSQIHSDDNAVFRKVAMKDVLNTGIVLGLKAERTSAIPKDTDGISGKDAEDADAGAIGGIIGASRSSAIRISNIQSKETKQYMLELVGFSSSQIEKVNELTIRDVDKVLQASDFGGNEVGGLIGVAFTRGYVNNVKKEDNMGMSNESLLDAVVIGQNYVGGAVGRATYDSQSKAHATYIKNIFTSEDSSDASQLKGLHIMGRDIVGGLFGCLEEQYELAGTFLDTKREIDKAYYIWGRYSVGGVAGEYGYGKVSDYPKTDYQGLVWLRNLRVNPESPVIIRGVHYVGGFVGTVNDVEDNTRKLEISDSISNIEVHGDAFVGAYFGAQVVNNKVNAETINTLTEIKDHKFVANNILVDGKIYAGGLSGLFYAVPENSFKKFSYSENAELSGDLYVLADSLKNSITTDNENEIITDIYGKVSKTDILNAAEQKEDSLFHVDASKAHTLDLSNVNLSLISVNSSVFAGGLFGYVPERLKLTISNYTNKANVYTSTSINNVDDSYDKTIKYSFLGGVIGRVPMNTVLLNCKNEVLGAYSSSAEVYYDSASADYMGGLAEVNAGIVKGSSTSDYCVNATAIEKAGTGVGAFVGVNGTKNTDGLSNGRILYCQNMAVLTGKNVGGIAATSGGASTIIGSENHGALVAESGGSAGGILCDVTNGVENDKLTTIANCVNTGVLTVNDSHLAATAAGIVFNTKEKGVLNNCRNYGTGLVNGITSADSGKTARSIHYCFDASDANNHIGNVNSTATNEDMYMNYYIGEDSIASGGSENIEEGDHFVATQFYTVNYSNAPIYQTYPGPGPFTFQKRDENNLGTRVLGIGSVATDRYTHKKENLWKIKDEGDYLAFEIRPVQSDGSQAYANMNTFAMIWDNYYKTEYSAFYEPYDKRATEYKDYYSLFERPELITYYQVAYDECVSGAHFAGRANYQGFLKNQVNGDPNNIAAPAFTVYYNMWNQHASELEGKTQEEIIEYYLDSLYAFLNVNSYWNQNGAWITDYATNPQYADSYTSYCASFEMTMNTELTNIILAEYSEDTNQYASANHKNKNYMANCFYNGTDDYLKYAFSALVQYSKENNISTGLWENGDAGVFDELLTGYMTYLYSNAGDYDINQYDKISASSKYVYDIIFTDINEKVFEATQVEAELIGTEWVKDSFDVDNFNKTCRKAWTQPGFNSAEIKKITIIMLENRGTGSAEINSYMGVRAFQWIPPNSGGDELVAMDTIESDPYDECTDIDDIMDTILSKHMKTTKFVVDRKELSPFELRLVKNKPEFSTEIDEISFYPLGTDYKTDFASYNSSGVRVKMWRDMDAKYQAFLQKYHVSGTVDIVR